MSIGSERHLKKETCEEEAKCGRLVNENREKESWEMAQVESEIGQIMN